MPYSAGLSAEHAGNGVRTEATNLRLESFVHGRMPRAARGISVAPMLDERASELYDCNWDQEG
jgi:hypothetical protein